MITYLALQLPGAQAVSPPTGFRADFTNLGNVISIVLDLIIAISAVLMFFWMIWGIFQYLYAGGDKEALGKARSRITMALVGFVIVILAFLISEFAQTIIPFRSQQPVTEVERPTP